MGVEETLDEYRKAPIHPNRISAAGGLLSLCSVVAAAVEPTRLASPVIYAAGGFCDAIDGKIARDYNLRSVEGAKLDPLMDKFKNLFVGSYMVAMNITNVPLIAANVANFTVDYISQKKRGSILEQLVEAYNAVVHPETCTKDDISKESKVRANMFGKVKTSIQGGVHFLYLSSVAYGDAMSKMMGVESSDISEYVNYGCAGFLFASAACGAVGLYKRMKKSSE